MNKIAIAFLTKDKPELTMQVLPSLVKRPFDLFWFDGSSTKEGQDLLQAIPPSFVYHDVLGGPDAAVARALQTLLEHPNAYTHIGLCENDVLLDPDWFEPTMALFDTPSFKVGAVSARCYEDRILIQRDGFAIVHNLGWGQQILSREAAELTLANMRTGWTSELRRTFCALSGLDIGPYWAFRTNDHQTCADWQNDRMLAAHGLASLALTPSLVEMIGQDPPLEQQGLVLAKEPVDARRNDMAFERYATTLTDIREACSEWREPHDGVFRDGQGASIYFTHHLRRLECAEFIGDWRLRWAQGFGPFGVRANEANCTFDVAVSGTCEFLVSGGPKGAQVLVEDLHSGYSVKPVLPGEAQVQQGSPVMSLVCPAGVSHRRLRLTAITPGATFYGVKTREPQLENLYAFKWSDLPPV